MPDCLLWAVFFQNHKSSPNFLATFFLSIDCVLFFSNIGLGYILGEFATNSSGHPGWGLA
jgi:hypothetical protein